MLPPQQQHDGGGGGPGNSRSGSGVTAGAGPGVAANARESSYLASNSGGYRDEKSAEEGGTSNKTISEYCCIWPLSLLNNKPIWRLFLVMFLNGLLSMVCSALIVAIEEPSQVRYSHVQIIAKVELIFSHNRTCHNRVSTVMLQLIIVLVLLKVEFAIPI